MERPVNWFAVRIICLDTISCINWKKYCNLHWSFLSLFDRIFFVGTSFIFKLLLFFFSGVCSIIDFQRYRLILCNIEGQSEFSKNANSSIHGNIKKMFEPTFLQLYFLIEYCFWPCNIVILCFKLLATLIYLKPKMHNVAAIGSANWLYSPLCIVLPKEIVLFAWLKHPIKMIKNAFYFLLKALFVLKIFKFLSRIFGHVAKATWLHVNSKIHDVITWSTNNCNTHIPQYLRK